jgi:hypothetical protein
MANEAQIYEGNQVLHVIDGAQITSGSFSVVGDIDNVVDNTFYKFPLAKVILVLNDLSAAPSAGLTVDLYRRGLNVVGTADEPEPDANFKATFVGSFLIDAVDPAATDTPYVLMGIPLLPNEMQFYIQNNLGVTISANWDLNVIPYTYKPAS